MKHAFSVLLSVSFLLSNGPAKALLIPISEVLTESSFSGKRQQQLLIAEASEQFEIDEQDRIEEPDTDPDDDGLFYFTSFLFRASNITTSHTIVGTVQSTFTLKVPLYIFLHCWKSFLR